MSMLTQAFIHNALTFIAEQWYSEAVAYKEPRVYISVSSLSKSAPTYIQ